MKELMIRETENGFTIEEHGSILGGMHGRTWSFESAGSLSEFMGKWAEERQNQRIKKDASVS